MPVRSIFCRLVLWVVGVSSVSLSMSGSVVASSSRVLVDRWVRCSRDSVRRFIPRVWLIACLVVVINRVILGCDGAHCLCPITSVVAFVRARFLSFLCCHCLVIASQCLAVCLSCRAFHCCRPMLSGAVSVAFSPLAAAGLVPALRPLLFLWLLGGPQIGEIVPTFRPT